MFCKNCGRNLGNTAWCPICDVGGLQPTLPVKSIRSTSSTVFMILYAVCIGVCAIWQHLFFSNLEEEFSLHVDGAFGGGGLLIFVILTAVPVYFMAKKSKLRLCVIFLLVGMAFLAIGIVSSILSFLKEAIDQEYGYETELFSLFTDRRSAEYEEMQFGLKIIKIYLGVSCFFAFLVPSVVLTSATLFTSSKKTFTALMIVAVCIAALVSLITFFWQAGPYSCLILFLGLYLRENYDALLAEKRGRR